MAEITAGLVKDLREKSGAGMMDCKKALSETNGDIEKALDWLRQKGLGAAAKKATRVAAEGLIGVASDSTSGVLVEVNAETDFVGRNDLFQHAVENIAKIALQTGDDVAKIGQTPFGEGRSVSEQLTHLIATIGENMNLRRAQKISVKNGVVASYIHSAVKVGVLGKIGVLVGLESTADKALLLDLGKKLAMHIAAANPIFLDIASVDADSLAREKEVRMQKLMVIEDMKDQTGAANKDCEEALQRANGDVATAVQALKDRGKNNPKKPLPADKKQEILQKQVDGQVRKYYEEACLTEQIFVVDGETKIADLLTQTAKTSGCSIAITGFVLYRLGDGIEKKTDDFAAEVAQMAGV